MPGNDDIIYDAVINDKTAAFFDAFDKRVEKMAQASQTGWSKVEGGMKSAAAVGSFVGNVFGNVAIKVAEQFLEAAFKVREFADQAFQLAARAETLGVTLDIVGGNAGYSAEQLYTFEAGLRKTGISITAARQSLTQMAQAELDLTKASDLARVSQDAAVIAGVNSSQAYQTILHGITTVQPEILRGLGLVINMQEELDKYSAKTGKATNSISVQEKQQIALNAVMTAGKKIAGSYEAAMDTVGKKLTTIPRYVEDIAVAFGEAFLPAGNVIVTELLDGLKDMLKYLEDNKDAIAEFGDQLATMVEMALPLIENIVGWLVKLPGAAVDAAVAIGEVGAKIAGLEAGKKEDLGTYWAQALSIIGGAANVYFAIWEQITKTAKYVVSMVDIGLRQLSAIKKGDFEAAKQLNKEYLETSVDLANSVGTDLVNAFNEGFLWTAKFTGAIKDADSASDAAGNSFDKAAQDAENLAASMATASTQLQQLYDTILEDAADRAIKDMREATEAALKESWRLEDAARNYAADVARIMENAAESQKQAAQNFAQEKINIEKEYQRKIRDLQRQFESTAREAARRRDAIALLEAVRQHEDEVEEAKQSKQDALSDAKAAWKLQLKQIEQQKQQQLEALDEQYAAAEEEYQRSLARQEELQKLHDQWEKEDRDKAYAEKLADLMKNFKSMKGMTDTNLKTLMDKWETYFGDLVQLAYDSMNAVNTSLTTTTPGTTTTPYNWNYIVNQSSGSVSGQAGQVSQMLGNRQQYGIDMYRPIQTPPQVPSVSPISKSQKQLEVSVNGAALEPYMQRVLVNALMEIERNNG